MEDYPAPSHHPTIPFHTRNLHGRIMPRSAELLFLCHMFSERLQWDVRKIKSLMVSIYPAIYVIFNPAL